MRIQFFCLFVLCALLSCDNKDKSVPIDRKYSLSLLDNLEVYNDGKHSAFTSLIKYDGKLLLAFRSAINHVAATRPDKWGDVKILSYDEQTSSWREFGYLYGNGKDLRDPFLVVFNGRLRAYVGWNDIVDGTYGHAGTLYADYIDGEWSELQPVINDAPHVIWIWKVREFNGLLYGVGYLEGYKPLLMSSNDGVKWETVAELNVEGIVSEADLCFIDNCLYICLRKDTPSGSPSYWGKSIHPFTDFQWKTMDVSIACPEFYFIEETKQILIAGRGYVVQDNKVQELNMSIFEVDREGNVIISNKINKGADIGYGSFENYKGQLWLSYYVGTQTEASIYMAKFQMNR